MMSTSRNLAASRYGVAPIERRRQLEVLAVAPDRRALGDRRVRIRAVRQQRLHQIQTASQHRRMQRGVADRRRRSGPRPCRAAAMPTACWPLWAATTSALAPSGSVSLTSAPAVDQDPRRLGVARPCRKQQRRAAASRDRVVELFAAGPLRHLAGHGLRVDARAGAHVRAALDQRLDHAADASVPPPTSARSGRATALWR